MSLPGRNRLQHLLRLFLGQISRGPLPAIMVLNHCDHCWTIHHFKPQVANDVYRDKDVDKPAGFPVMTNHNDGLAFTWKPIDDVHFGAAAEMFGAIPRFQPTWSESSLGDYVGLHAPDGVIPVEWEFFGGSSGKGRLHRPEHSVRSPSDPSKL